MKIVSAIITLNPTAVFVALMAHFLVGLIWYSVFGKVYSALRGMDIRAKNQWVPLGMLAHVFYTIALAVIVNLAGASTVMEGLIIGSMIAIGFIGTILVNELAYSKIPFKLFLLKFGDEFIALCVAAVILSLWK